MQKKTKIVLGLVLAGVAVFAAMQRKTKAAMWQPNQDYLIDVDETAGTIPNEFIDFNDMINGGFSGDNGFMYNP